MEGGIDSSHVSFLHRGASKRSTVHGRKGNEYNRKTCSRNFEVVEFEGGLLDGARRNAEDGRYYWRITPWSCLLTMVPPRGDHPIHGHFWVPIDDETAGHGARLSSHAQLAGAS